VLGKLLLILAGLIIVSLLLEDLSRPQYQAWYLADAQKRVGDDRVVHATRNSDRDTLAFETPLMDRALAMATVQAGNVASNAMALGYHTFTFSNGTRSWTYDLQTKTLKP